MVTNIDFRVGDIVRVHTKIKEGEKTRTQIFQGVVLGIRGRGENKSYTVRKTVGDVSVERIWHVGNPNVDKVDVKGKPKTTPRRAKLNYLKSPRLNP
ncbi:MAG: 50S ribosomal protein L19 [Candidatus Levybacteria bacterium]|nr:50S ribosomal protein L19 [Candidatus Levybacteria bacterium]